MRARREERVEDALAHLRGEVSAVVEDAQTDLVRRRPQRVDSDLAPRPFVLRRVEQDVDERAVQQLWICAHLAGVGREHDERRLAQRRITGRVLRDGADRSLDERAERHDRELRVRRAREREQVADEAVQALGLLVEDVEQLARVRGRVTPEDAAQRRARVRDDRERVAHLVREHRAHLPDGGESLAPDELDLHRLDARRRRDLRREEPQRDAVVDRDRPTDDEQHRRRARRSRDRDPRGAHRPRLPGEEPGGLPGEAGRG